MANKKRKSTSRTKESPATRRPKSGDNRSAKTIDDKNPNNAQVKAIILLASAVLLFALVIFPGASLWSALRSFMYGVFGFCFILIPFILGYFAIITAKEKTISRLSTKIVLTTLIVLLTSSLFFLFGSGDYKSTGFFDSMTLMVNRSSNTAEFGLGGGAISCLLGYPLVKMTGDSGLPKFIAIVLLIVCIMILTGISLVDVANVAKKQMSTIREARRKKHPESEGDDPAVTASAEPKPDRKGHPSRIDIPITIDGKPANSGAVEPEKAIDDDDAPLILDASERLINSVRIANGDYIDETGNYKASTIARHISESKGNPHLTSGAKQPDPETVGIDPNEVPVDLDKETMEIKNQIKRVAKKKPGTPHYNYPSVRLLRHSADSNDAEAMRELQDNATKLIAILNSFGVSASICNICRGPSVTRYELKPAPGVKINKITNLADDLALGLAADGVRIEAPIPGKAAIGIEVPNKYVSTVTMRELIDSDEFRSSQSKLTCVLGKDISGNIVTADLAKMPHLLIAGTTGSGKSVCVNSILLSILYKATPTEVKFVLIDPKMVEFSKYKGLPHLLVPVVSDAKKAAGALNWAVTEMMQRYKLFSEYDCKEIHSYNQLIDANLKYIEENSTDDEEVCMEVAGLPVPKEKLPQIVIAIDELSDLMMVAPKEVEDAICRLAQMARAAGMHLVIATQRPSVNVITGIIKANIPSRLALKVSSNVDSRTILDFGGAESLIGRGDMLFAPVGSSKPLRVQGCYASDDEIEGVTGFVKKQNEAEYNAEVEEQIRRITAEDLEARAKGSADDPDSDVDARMEEAIKCVIDAGQASTSLLQRRLKVGYARAGRMIDDMEQMGIVGPHQGAKPRDVLITYQDWLERSNRISD